MRDDNLNANLRLQDPCAQRRTVIYSTLLALLAGFALALACTVWQPSSGGMLVSRSHRAARQAADAAADRVSSEIAKSVSVLAERSHAGCRWHQGTNLNLADWWIAEKSIGSKRMKVTDDQYSQLTALLQSIELDMQAAARDARRELESAIASHVENRDAILSASASLDGSISLFLKDVVTKIRRVHIKPGDCPAFTEAIAREVDLHDRARGQVEGLISSFK